MAGSQGQVRLREESNESLVLLGIAGVVFWVLVASGTSGWVNVAAMWMCTSMCLLAVAAATANGPGRAFQVTQALVMTWFAIGAALCGYLALSTSDARLEIVAWLAGGGLLGFIGFARAGARPTLRRVSLAVAISFVALLMAFELRCLICDGGVALLPLQ